MNIDTDKIYGESRPTLSWQTLVDLFYKGNAEARDILVEHSRAVADLALKINRERHLGLEDDAVEFAAMVHDIGIVATDAPGIGCNGVEPYIRHGVVGGRMLREAGAPEFAARVAERHTGVGLTAADIKRQNLPLPLDVTLYPETLLEKLICYADKFFSKRRGQLSQIKSKEKVRAEMLRHGEDSLLRFDRLDEIFGTERNA